MAEHMTAEQLRAEFEPWAELERFVLTIVRGIYADELTRAAFAGYCAARLSGMAAVPEGWKLVPLQPTDDMIDVGHAEYERAMIGNRRNVRAAFNRRWRAMCDAAPEPPHV